MRCGRYLEGLARWLTRADTFERLVSPAIADLQCEAGRGRLMRMRHYMAVGGVLVWAIVGDLSRDAGLAFEPGARHGVWRRAAWWYLAAVGVFAWIGSGDTPWHLLDAATRQAALISAALNLPFAAMAPATAAAVFYLRRHGAPIRTIVAVTMLVVAATTVLTLAISQYNNGVSMQIYERVDAALPAAAREGGHSDHRWSIWLDYRRDDLVDRSSLYRSGAGMVPWALLGFVLARGRNWKVPVRLTGFVATWFALGYIVLRIDVTLRMVPSTAYQRWRDVVLMLATSLIWLLVERMTSHGPGEQMSPGPAAPSRHQNHLRAQE